VGIHTIQVSFQGHQGSVSVGKNEEDVVDVSDVENRENR
jgi:hypothetical protein